MGRALPQGPQWHRQVEAEKRAVKSVKTTFMSFPVRYFFRFEVEHLLVRAGFRLVDVFGDFDRSPLGDRSPEMIFVAEP